MPTLTQFHERDHFNLLHSTPLGLLLWRISQCITVDVRYLDRTLEQAGFYQQYSIQFPYLEWLDYFEEQVSRVLINSDVAEKHDYFFYVLDNVFNLRHFVSSLFTSGQITIGDFIDVATQALEYLGDRSDLETNVRWVTALDRNRTLQEAGVLSLIELIEAAAKFAEAEALGDKAIDRGVVEKWINTTLFGVYEKGVTWLASEFRNSITPRVAIDIALSSPIDIAYYRTNSIIRLEDVLPQFRIAKIVRSINSRRAPSSAEELFENTLQGYASDANIPTPREVYSHLKQSPLWGDANWGGQIIVMSDDPDLMFLE